MTYDELERQEEANRDLREVLGQLSKDVQASPGFVARVMTQVDRQGSPSRGWLNLPYALLGRSPYRLRLALAALVVVACIGAVPQYSTWISAYRMDVPPDTLYEAKLQEKLWEKNFSCATQLNRQSSNYAAITGEHVVVVAWACPSGDVLVTLESTTDDVLRRTVWIPLDSQRQAVGLLEGWVRTAFAADARQEAKKDTMPMITVLCQKWLHKRLIIRRIQLANGRCFDEVINPRTGEVKQRRKSPCDRDC